ncbi:MAG: hypothetical protein KIB10_12510 [Enterococcus avium]|jgi:hypothetical protein|uniref:hypothetical protein n=1 Tax=Enterococcus raffinosus TaxID=71452 RepID=UPI0022E7B644|nr:hypothetical protein [Enterococcus raffinosus]MBS6070219.1 hypothetical protein [Enterococcus avium]
MNDFLEEMCKQNSDPESETLWSMETIIMSGKIPKVKTDLKKNFFQSFSKAAITPDVIIVEGENYRAEFVNRTTNYVIPTEVEQVKNALEKLAELYPADEYGVENIEVSCDEGEIILAKEFPPEEQLNPDNDFYDVFGSEPGDFYFIQNGHDSEYEWVVGKNQLLEIGSPMPKSEKKNGQNAFHLMVPKDYCPSEFYHQTIKYAYKRDLFVDEVLCESDGDVFFDKLTEKTNSMCEKDSLAINDFQELIEVTSYDRLCILFCNTPGKGSIFISNERNTEFLNFWKIYSLQEFSANRPFINKFRKAISDLEDYM